MFPRRNVWGLPFFLCLRLPRVFFIYILLFFCNSLTKGSASDNLLLTLSFDSGNLKQLESLILAQDERWRHA